MISPAGKYESQELRRLASAVMDGVATTEQQQQLTTMLRDHEEARDEYLAFVDMHAFLATELVGAAEKQDERQPRRENQSKSANAFILRRSWISIVVAASILTVIGLFVFSQQEEVTVVEEQSADESFAEIAQALDVEWRGVSLQNGTRLEAQNIAFNSGIVRLLFDDGVEVTLEGPAEYELSGPGQTILLAGVLTATVPKGAEGFTVNTPTAEVVDLGTSFGIDLTDDGFASVAVFDGEVEVAARKTLEKRLITEGQSVRIGMNQKIEDTDLQTDRYERLWPIASGIVRSSDTFRCLPPWPKRVRFVQSDNDIFVAAEGYAVELTRSLSVNISEPGRCAKGDELTPIELTPGKNVRSYILHYMPETQVGRRRAQRISGSITFDHPVVGLIVQHEELLASSRLFRRRAAGEQQHRRQLDFSDGRNGDIITLSDDRQTVTVDLISAGRSSDLVRVIVDAGNLQ